MGIHLFTIVHSHLTYTSISLFNTSIIGNSNLNFLSNALPIRYQFKCDPFEKEVDESVMCFGLKMNKGKLQSICKTGADSNDNNTTDYKC